MSYFQHFKQDVSKIERPIKFTFPFYYDPHPLTLIASEELQSYLLSQSFFKHNFGVGNYKKGFPHGKMFGVLVVEDSCGTIGYLTAFSGNIQSESESLIFVPPVYNVHEPNTFYKQTEERRNILNQEILDLEDSQEYKDVHAQVQLEEEQYQQRIQEQKAKNTAGKKLRKLKRAQAKKELTQEEYEQVLSQLAKESVAAKNKLKYLLQELQKKLSTAQEGLEKYTCKISQLKQLRKEYSNKQQQEIFSKYIFLNKKKKEKSLLDIFPKSLNKNPPAGAGDCVAPKLLQHAFKNNLKPISMGEFWWGVSPSKEIRKHKTFYPACGGRCKPILSHMLEGITLDENPFLKNSQPLGKIQIIYEDSDILVVNKPAELLSVPGMSVSDSVQTRLQLRYPNLDGPYIIHRLDMSTSGILVLAKTKEAHKFIQRQFIKRTILKKYVAVVDGIIENDSGIINLPLRLDIHDRPRQLVCFEHGKAAKTRWEVIERVAGRTRIQLFPLTGRTHQLRVHLSHPKGLNTAIVGDDLYGNKSNRLLLHAEEINFVHPTSREEISFKNVADF